MARMTNRQKKKAKKKRDRKKKWAPRKHIGKGIFIGYTLILSLFVLISLAGVDMDTLSTSNTDFNFDIMGLSIKNPYDSSNKVVIFSDSNGNPKLDGTRTTWKETDLTYWNAFDIEDKFSTPKLLRYDVNTGSIRDKTGWVNAPKENYFLWAPGNSWNTMGISVDPDSSRTGVPNLAVSYSNLYPSDSNGNHDVDYGYEMLPRTLIDKNGTARDFELHTGFVTFEVEISVTADYYLDYTSAGVLDFLSGEVGGDCHSSYSEWSALGTGIDFEVVFRFQVKSLRFEDDWELNPDWLNQGNGILQVSRRGFGVAKDTEGDEYTVVTKDTSNWKYRGKFNDIEDHQNEAMQKYSSKEKAIDKSDVLLGDETKIVDFKTNNPNAVYASMQYYIDLGLNYEEHWLGGMKDGSIQIQKIVWVQKITVQFYTSVMEPLAGGGVDPATITITLPDDPPKDRIWDRIAQWLADLLGVKKEMAELIMIACIIGITLIVILVLLAIFAPAVLPAIAKGIGGFFKQRAARRAARK